MQKPKQRPTKKLVKKLVIQHLSLKKLKLTLKKVLNLLSAHDLNAVVKPTVPSPKTLKLVRFTLLQKHLK